MDPVSELLAQPFRLEKTAPPKLSDIAVERLNTVREFAPSEKLPYMTYDQVMSKESDVYSPSDFQTVGQRIRDNVVKAIETRFPIVGETYTLKVEGVHYEKPKQTALREEKEVLLNDGSLNDRLKGTWVLYDNATGKEVARKNATLLNVPRMTSRGTFIRNGSEIGLKHMFRLRSGVYTHIKNNGRVSAHINPEQTTGQQMSIEMEPSTGVFSISRGTRTYGLLPILKAAGVPDDVVKGYMGEDLYKSNYEKYGKLMGSDSQMEEYRKVWTENMSPIKLDAETTESTLGKGFSKMDPDVLLRASGRILQVSKTMSDNDTDDRDSLRYQRVMGPADYIPERIVRDGGGLLRKLFNTVTKSGNLDAVVTGAFQPHVDSVFLDDKHAGYIDGSSPMEALDFSNMISRIGEGGIGSLRAAPAETRGVNDSYLGFIDPVRCYSRNHQIMTVSGWRNIAEVTMHDKVACLINGAVEYHSPDAVHAYDYNQDLYCYSSKAVAYEVTGNHRMWVCKVARKGGQKKRGGYQKEYKPSFMFETAEDMHNTNRRVMTGGHAPYTGCWESRGTVDDFNYESYGISQLDWAAFMGWYLSEGSTLIKNDKGQADRNSVVSISQTKSVHPKDYEDICQLLSRLPWSFKASKQERELYIKSHELAQYLRRFGYCNDKYIPAQLFDMSVEARKAFMDAMMRGDGRQPQGNEGWVYTTTSEKLASGVERMLFDLGHCVTTHMYEDKRTDWYLPVYEVRATVSKQGWLIKNGREITEREERSDYYKTKPCDGKVFCVTVPGGMVYTRIKGHKGFWCGNSPESLKVGLDIYLTHGIMKDSSGKLYNKFKDKKGTPVVVPMDVTSKSIVATPEFYDPKGDPNEFIPAMYQGKGIEYVKRKDVDFYVDNSNTMMSVGSGMIPLIGGIRSNRTLMGCLHPDTMLAVIKDNKPTRISAFDLWVLFSEHTWGVPSLDDDNSSIIYRQIKKVVRHDLDDFDDSRLAVVNMRIFDDDDAGGLVCICTMDHKWMVRVGADTAQEQLLTTRDIMKTLEDGIKVYAPAVGYPHNSSFGALYGKDLSEVGYWKELSIISVLSTDEFKDHFVIDIDVDDHVYMLANGMFTHNSKYANQAVALQEPEAPLVQRRMVDRDGSETTTEKFISRQLGAKYAPVAGKVIKVDADSIVIAGSDGQKHTIDLYNEYPANQKGFIHNTALVKPGDKVEPNQILAKSNYTDDEGTAALGKNLNVAYMTGRNAGTFEDSIVISESAAKKMSSTQLYKLRGDTSDDIEYSKSRYLSLFKDDFTPEQLDKIAENGLPKPGVVFNMGDPVYLGVQTRDIGVHGLAKNAAVPYVTRWEHSAPGTVTNVVQGKKHLTVYTKAVTPMEIGDKLCFDDQTEILTDKGWRLFKDLDDTERVLTMDMQTFDTWMTAYSDRYSYHYKGKMYRLKTKHLDICTTPDHEHLIAVSNHNHYLAKLNSKQVIGRRYFHIVGQDVCNPHNYKPAQTDETEEGWVDYDGRVYCVTVPYTHTVFVRRNGKTVWSGNSSRYGNKGTVGEILPDEEMPKDSNGNTFDVLLSPLGIPSRCYDKDTEFLVQGKGWRKGSEVLETDLLYCFDPVTMTGRFDKQLEPMYKKRYKGIMFGYQNRCTDFLVTPGHKVYARTDYKGSQYKETIIDDVYNKRYIFPAVCRMSSWAEDAEPFHLPTIDIDKRDSYTTDDDIVYDAHDWAAFLGWYLSEGNTTYVNYGHREDGSVVSPNYRVHISQDANVHPEKASIIDKLLTRMGLTYSYGEHNKQFHISGKRLAHYLKQFGNCYEKYIPDWLFSQPESVIDAFLDAIWLGDGTHHLDTQSKQGLYKPGTMTFVKSIKLASERLIDQLQILFSMKGIKTVKTVVPPDKRHKGAHTLYHLGVSTRDAGVSCTRDRKGQSLHPQWYTKEYNDMVYCPTVPTGYVLTRRNGRVICLGNTNTSVLAELTLSKIAAKRGVKYVLPDFLDESIIDYVDRELKKHGIEPDEDVYDPVTGKTVPQIQTGKMFFYKLKHMAELKERGRSTGTYSAEDIPLKGEGAARRLGGMESSAVFSGGGMEVLRDAKIVRGQRNDEFWRDYGSGKYPETPGFPLVHQKFFAHLKAAGVNLEDRGDRVHLYGATDANMRELTGNRQVTKAATFESKNMQPIAGGLFDPTIFGADGDQWGYVDLPEPVLNPIMFKTVGSVLGWKDKELTEYLEGSRELNGKFGTQNLIDTLNNIDLPKELARAKQVLKSDSTTLEQRDMARKRIRAIEPMIREGKKPADFFFTRMPILPPRFRPVTAMSNGVGIAADANFLYKRMMDAAEDLREAKEVLPEEMQLDARRQLYSTVNAVTGLTPTDDPKLEAKGVAGVLKWAFGKGSPKCYDPETEILTERGWIKFPEYVAMQDYDLPVMTYKMELGKFEWQKPQRIFDKEYKGDMVHTKDVDSDGEVNADILVTADHEHYVEVFSSIDSDGTPKVTCGKSRAIDLTKIGMYWIVTPTVYKDGELDTCPAFVRSIPEEYRKPIDVVAGYYCQVSRDVVIGTEDNTVTPYDGLVYCVTVPNGLIVTRRNGCPVVSGNCGSLHRKVFGANLDLGSLGTITPDNSLTIDQVGIPERSAWKMFEPFVVRKLVQQGASVVDAMKGVLDQTDEARRALIDVMRDRPVLLNRAPTLWRYGIQGMYPVLVEGNALRVNPNVCKLYGADFDGNCLDFDSKIFVKLSQSALDFFERAMYINSNANQEGKKEENMSVARESLFGLSLSEGVYLMSIGKFPKVGEPFKDKNGADVYGLPSGIEVLSADPVTGEHKFCKVTSFTEEKDCECVEVTIDSRKVVVSSNATMAVFDHETGRLVKVPASEHNDRLVPVFKQCPVAFGDKYDRDFGWWLGALISDGWVTDRTVGYTKVEDNKRAEFIRIARTIHENFVANEYRGGKSEKKLAESVKVHLNGTDLAKKCMEFGIYADESYESITDRAALRKQVPYAMIHNGSEEFLYGLLSGLLDGDGSISKNTATKNVRFSCRLSTSSPYLRETFEILLYRLGIRWSTTVTPPRGWSKESYSICPSTVDMCSILDKLSCIGEKETALIAEWKDNISTKDDKDIVPISRDELDALKKNKLHTINMSLYDALNRKHASTRALAMKYVDFLKQHAPEFVNRLYMTNTLWRPISSVEDAGKRDVYDFAVPDTKVFAANTGIVIYDSMTTHVPVSKEAVRAIDEKMLPSRNLLSPIDMKAHFIPVAEFTQGLYLASRTRNEAPIRFKTKEDMMAALNRGEIKIDTPVVIG
jgi:DNA-directed RNA polymerase beta subunit